MLGHSHTGFALAGAMSANSLIYRIVPQPLSGDWDYFFHSIGQPLSYKGVAAWFHHPTPLVGDFWLGLLFKGLFYAMIIGCVMFPDQWERRGKEEGGYELRYAHRGATHSIAMMLLLIFLYAFVFLFTLAYLHVNKIMVNPLLLRMGCTLACALVLAFAFHILADMITRDGVKVLWPANANLGIPPVRAIRPRTGEWGEYAWLWLFIFITGILFALGLVGI